MANPQQHPNCYRTRQQLSVGEQRYQYHSLPALAQAGFTNVGRLPFSIRILLENLLRHEDGVAVKNTDIAAIANWDGAAARGGAGRGRPPGAAAAARGGAGGAARTARAGAAGDGGAGASRSAM